MKKFLTLITAAAMATGISAETISDIDQPTILSVSESDSANNRTFEVTGFTRTIAGKKFDSFVTPFEYDPVTGIASFTDFLGTDADFKLKFLIAENAKPGLFETMYYSEPVDGLSEPFTDQRYYTACYINNFNESVILKQDGVNFCKIDNLKIYIGNDDDMTFHSILKEYRFSFLFGGDYSVWNAETSGWEPKGNTQMFTINTTLSFEPDIETGIDTVITEGNDNAPVEYYNLSGIRVANPADGIFIKRQGNKIEKVIVK